MGTESRDVTTVQIYFPWYQQAESAVSALKEGGAKVRYAKNRRTVLCRGPRPLVNRVMRDFQGSPIPPLDQQTGVPPAQPRGYESSIYRDQHHSRDGAKPVPGPMRAEGLNYDSSRSAGLGDGGGMTSQSSVDFTESTPQSSQQMGARRLKERKMRGVPRPRARGANNAASMAFGGPSRGTFTFFIRKHADAERSWHDLKQAGFNAVWDGGTRVTIYGATQDEIQNALMKGLVIGRPQLLHLDDGGRPQGGLPGQQQQAPPLSPYARLPGDAGEVFTEWTIGITSLAAGALLQNLLGQYGIHSWMDRHGGILATTRDTLTRVLRSLVAKVGGRITGSRKIPKSRMLKSTGSAAPKPKTVKGKPFTPPAPPALPEFQQPAKKPQGGYKISRKKSASFSRDVAMGLGSMLGRFTVSVSRDALDSVLSSLRDSGAKVMSKKLVVTPGGAVKAVLIVEGTRQAAKDILRIARDVQEDASFSLQDRDYMHGPEDRWWEKYGIDNPHEDPNPHLKGVRERALKDARRAGAKQMMVVLGYIAAGTAAFAAAQWLVTKGISAAIDAGKRLLVPKEQEKRAEQLLKQRGSTASFSRLPLRTLIKGVYVIEGIAAALTAAAAVKTLNEHGVMAKQLDDKILAKGDPEKIEEVAEKYGGRVRRAKPKQQRGEPGVNAAQFAAAFSMALAEDLTREQHHDRMYHHYTREVAAIKRRDYSTARYHATRRAAHERAADAMEPPARTVHVKPKKFRRQPPPHPAALLQRVKQAVLRHYRPPAVGLAKKGGKKYPWEKCVRDARKRYGSLESARRVCGKIKANRGASLSLAEKLTEQALPRKGVQVL